MKKKILLIIVLILILVPAFIFLVPVKDGRTVYKNIKYKQLLAGATQPDNYDKMKISYARITKRETGETPFNTPTNESVDDGSLESNSDGIDVSIKDDYVRTFDEIHYTVEVGIDRNLETTTDLEQFKGGVIKVRATLPKSSDGKTIFSWDAEEPWMQNETMSADETTITAEYIFDESKTVIGGNQELSFSIIVGGYKEEITDDLKPTFEFWMEGNEPDNPDSTASSITIKDEEDLIISGIQSYKLGFLKGSINQSAVVDGVEGNYVHFGVTLNTDQPYDYLSSTPIGVAYPSNDITVDLDLDYYYDNLDDDEGWILIDENTENATDIINGLTFIAGNVSCRDTPGFWPDSKKNNFGSGKCGDTHVSGGSQFLYHRRVNSGTMTYTQNIDQLQIKNSGYWQSGDFASIYNYIIFDGLEFFVPHYKNGSNNYQYQIVVKGINVNIPNDDGTEYNVNPDKEYVIEIISRLTGSMSYNLSGNTPYQLADVSEQFLGVKSSYTSYLFSDEGPYLGGDERLITFDSSKIEPLPDDSNISVSLTNNGLFETPSKDNIHAKLGIYKNNNGAAISDDSIINSATKDDFDWYDTKQEAESHGVISAILIVDPDYRGYSVASYVNIPFMAINNTDNINEEGILRQKIYLYGDADKTQVFISGEDKTYVRGNAYSSGSYGGGKPALEGQTFVIRLAKPYITMKTYDHVTHEEKNLFDIEERYADYVLTPTLVFGNDEIKPETLNIRFTATIPSDMSYKENSANIEPTIDGSTMIWDLEWDTSTRLPIITYTLEYSPYIKNNTFRQYYGKFGYYIGNNLALDDDTSLIHFSNLAGSSMRKSASREFVETEEVFEMTDTLYNISEQILTNVKTVEILPKDNDGSSEFNGTYTIKVQSLGEGQQVYYTTNNIDNIGLTEDSMGNQTIQNVDLSTDSRWIQVNVNDIIPATATAIATHVDELNTMSDISFKYQVIPVDNKQRDKYIFKTTASSDNLVNAVRSDILRVSVIDRIISGTVFEDLNRNDLLNDTDAMLNNYTIELLNEEGIKIDETTTDVNGHYEFGVEKRNYFIRVTNLPDGYELLPKATNNESNSINSTLVSDLINHTGVPHDLTETITVNYGIRKKPATLVVKYLDKNNNQPLANQVESTVYYTDNYETHGLTTIPENYSFLENAGAPVADVVNSDYIEVIYYYDFTPATITAKHYLDGTTNKIHEDVIQNKKLTQPYSTSVLDTTNLNYEYVRTDGDNTSGTVDKTEIVVNYYYKLKKGIVTTHHYLYDNGDTTTKLAPDITREWNYTETYTTSTSDQVPANYEFYKKSNNYTNVMSSPSVEVNYYYQLKDSNLTTTITQTGTEEITSKNDVVNYELTYNAKVVDYIGDGTITIVETLPYAIDVDNSDLDGGTYNASDKTITWTVEWDDINTYEDRDETTITKNMSLKYVGIVGRDRIMTSTATGNIVLSNNNREVQTTTATDIKISGNIKVIYIDEETNDEIFDAIEEEDLVGEEFISVAKEKDGYKLVTKPDSETFEFEEEDQLITYGYEHIKFEIKGKVLGVGGSIRGDEDVYWGEDSTEGNIIVEADEGYIIEAILVNGERMDIEPGQVTLVLENFKEVLENKNIEVVFAKKPQENPNTKAFIGLIILISWLILFTNAILLKKSQELE